MVRSDTVPVLGRNLEFEINRSKKTIPLLAKMMNLDSRTIYNSIKSKNVSPTVLRVFSYFFKRPISFFTDHISDNDIILRPIKNWKNYAIGCQNAEDFDYELKFKDNINKSEFETYKKLIKNFLEELHKTIQKKYIDESEKDKFYQLDSFSNFLELSSLGEELNKHSINVYYCYHFFWEQGEESYSGNFFDKYTSYNKQHLLFTNSINSEKYYSTTKIGNAPPNPYKIFVAGPHFTVQQSFIINNHQYSISDFMNFWGSDFDKRRDRENSDFINKIQYWVQLENEIDYPQLSESAIESIMLSLEERDKKINEINSDQKLKESIKFDKQYENQYDYNEQDDQDE